jgi:thioredoxin 1
VSEKDFFDSISTGFCIVKFWSPDCRPCKIIDPIFLELEQEYHGKLKIIAINTLEFPKIALKMRVIGLPTVIYFLNGEPVHVFYTTYPKDSYRQKINEYINL